MRGIIRTFSLSMHQFQFRWIPFIATCLLAAVFLRLGWWQWSKAVSVESQMTLRDARSTVNPVMLGSQLVDVKEVDGASVVVRGSFDATAQFFLDNQQHQGRPGLHVITPFKIEGTQVRVLVNRGWVGWGNSREALPEVSVPTGRIEIHGRVTLPSTKSPAFVSESLGDTGVLRTRIRMDEIQASQDYPLQPILVLMMSADASDELVRDWPELSNKVPMHQGYAAQWFLMALLLLAFFVRSCYRKINV
jgi:surfeit locus 1 family protein